MIIWHAELVVANQMLFDIAARGAFYQSRYDISSTRLHNITFREFALRKRVLHSFRQMPFLCIREIVIAL